MITVDGIEITPTLFPDKTSQVWKLPEETFLQSRVVVKWDFESEAEFIHLAQLKDLLDVREIKADLEMPYLPYARQDKGTHNERTFGLHTFAKLLNTLKFERVSCFDPHSDEPGLMIRNFFGDNPYRCIKHACNVVKPDMLCFPDGGAYTKYFGLPFSYPKVWGEKDRDQETGKIRQLKIKTNGQNLGGRRVLVVDDLCDAGNTFVMLAKTLKEDHDVAQLDLYVSHGLFTKGIDVLRDAGYKHIFTKEGLKYEFSSTLHRSI